MKVTRPKPLTSAQLRKKYKFVVPVPKSSPRAYRPDRPISGLVAHQLQHLQMVEQSLPARHRLGADLNAIKTEGQAASFVAHVTNALHALHAPPVLAKPRRKAAPKRPARRPRRAPRRGRRA
jgi:hypothetical protein